MFDAHCQPVPFATLMQRSRAFTPTTLNSALPARPVDDDAYARGLADGEHFAATAFEVNRLALQALIASSYKVEAGNSDELSAMIRETVFRLVEQIVGTVEIDRAFVERQIGEATALITDTDDARTLWLNPEDNALLADGTLSLNTRTDPNLQRGEVRIDCSGGWIEHKVAFGIEKLRESLGIEGASA